VANNKSILITGASRSIGLRLAKHYCKKGYKVFGCSRTSSEFKHKEYKHFITDISDSNAVRKMFVDIKSEGSQIDIVINNAGSTQSSLALLTNTDEAKRIVNTNFIGTFIMLREAIRHMKRVKQGRIINFTSINTVLGHSGSTLYDASKAAIENLASGLSAELLDEDITINSIGLSLVEKSGMTKKLSEKSIKEKLNRLTKKQTISITEIAHTIDFLTSDNAKSITNQTIFFGGVK
jgi:3-oxoacyl-[acyl-carrier protein] reductase